MGLVSLDDGALDGVEGLSSLVDEAPLGDGALGVVEDPSSLVDEASLGDGALGDVLDHSHFVRGFLRWSGENFASLTLKSEIGRASCRERV